MASHVFTPYRFLGRALGRRTSAALLAAGLAAAIVPAASAHHSTAAFDAHIKLPLEGTVTKVNWANPHIYIHLLIKGEDGTTREWSVISGTPQLNIRHGWKRDDVKVGDKVAMTVYPDRSGRPQGILVSIKLANGRSIKGLKEFLTTPTSE